MADRALARVPSAAVAGEAAPPRSRSGWRLLVDLYRRDGLGVAGFLGLAALAVLGVVAPLVAAYPTSYGKLEYVNLAPGPEFPFGTDELGRSIFNQTIWGIRSSFYVSAIATVIATLVGIVIGLLSGYSRGKLGDLFTGIIDIFLTLPVLPLMILLASVFPPSRTTLGLVIG